MSRIIVGTVALLFLLAGGTWVLGRRAKAELAAKYPPPGQAARIETLGDIPLVVLSAPDQFADLEKRLSAEDAGQIRAVTEELQAELAALSPNGRRVIVRDSGHYIQVEQPEAVIDAIRQVVEAARR